MNEELFRRKRMLETAQSIEGFEGFPRKGGGKGSRYETEPKLPGGYGAWLCHFAPSYTQFSKRGDFETKSREIFNAWSMPAAGLCCRPCRGLRRKEAPSVCDTSVGDC